MKANKDIWSKYPFLKFAAVATAFCLLFLLLKKDNLFTWIKTGFDIADQKRQIEQLKQENAELDLRMKALSEDKDSLETFAREEYLFAAPGDDVYVIE